MDHLYVVSYGWAMKPDIDYTKKLLDVLEAMPTPTYGIEDLQTAGVDIADPAFFQHICLFEDRGLFASADPARPQLYSYAHRDLPPRWQKVQMRLTAQGHDFAAALRTPQVVETIKSKAGEAGFAIWVQVAATMATAYFLKKVGLPQ